MARWRPVHSSAPGDHMSLFDITLAAILSVAKPPTVDVVGERPRLEDMAVAIVSAVEQRDHLHAWLGSVAPLPFTGSGADAATALALVAIAYHESGFSARVADCRRIGAFERSVTAFQLHGPFARGSYTEAEVCASPRLAAERALYVFALHGHRCATPQLRHPERGGPQAVRHLGAAREIRRAQGVLRSRSR
jgi:hypothetical protein